MTRAQRIVYKLLAWVVLFVSVYLFPPMLTVEDPTLELLVIGVLYGVAASCLHDAIGHHIVGTLVSEAGWRPLQLVVMYVIIATYAAVAGVILWASGVIFIAFLPGLGEPAMAEAQSIAPIAVGVTVVSVEAINEAVGN